MRVAPLMTMSFAICACTKASDDRFWGDRPDEMRKGTVAGTPFTILVPTGLAHRKVEGREEFFVEGSGFGVTISWATPDDATRRLTELQGRFDKLERVGLDGAAVEMIEVDPELKRGDAMAIELAGAKVGFIVDATGPARRDIYAFLPSGRPDGGFACATDVPVIAPEQTRTLVARARGICLSLRTALSP